MVQKKRGNCYNKVKENQWMWGMKETLSFCRSADGSASGEGRLQPAGGWHITRRQGSAHGCTWKLTDGRRAESYLEACTFSVEDVSHVFSKEWEGRGRVEVVRTEKGWCRNFREPGRDAETGTVCALRAGGTWASAPCPGGCWKASQEGDIYREFYTKRKNLLSGCRWRCWVHI